MKQTLSKKKHYDYTVKPNTFLELMVLIVPVQSEPLSTVTEFVCSWKCRILVRCRTVLIDINSIKRSMYQLLIAK